MDSNELRIYQVEGTRMCLVQDALKKLYSVKIIEKETCTTEKHGNSNTVSESYSKPENESNKENRNKVPVSEARLPASHQGTAWKTLCFEGVSPEDIEKAKSFAAVHLLPSPDYITSTHQLENQQEFNMVLESAQNIQTTTMALVTFDPGCLEVTLRGSQSNVASARSKVVMILDKIREQARTDSGLGTNIDFNSDNHKFYEDLLLCNFVEKQNNKDSSELSHEISNAQNPNEIANLKQQKSQENYRSNTETVARLANKNILSSIHFSQLEENNFDDIDCDATNSPATSEPVNKNVVPIYGAYSERLRSLSPSSEDEGSLEENLPADPQYSKKIEQALKLGYSEKHGMKALAKLGPGCELNDFLSELIRIGPTDVDPSESQSLSPEIDYVFSNDGLDLEQHGKQRLNVFGSESEDISSFSSSTDSRGSGKIDVSDSSNLRDIIIDGSNVAMSHGKKAFSCKGIQIAVSWFRERGHKNIIAFVPQWRKETSRPDAPITDQDILSNLEKEGVVVFTPARRVKGRRVVCYDDRYILKLAVETDGIVVSNDVYRDLVNEREDFRKVVEQRLLMYSFVNDRFMPPEDPLGRLGPTLDNFLRKVPAEPTPKPQDCPYGKKCTYGNKCRFYHPERGFAPQKLITETLKEQADLKLQERATRLSEMAEKGKRSKQKLSRTNSVVPGESLPSQSGAKSKQEKPKLAHSKSLVFPTKSSDYLNEPRKKLEEAELTAAMEKMSTQDASFLQQYPTPVFSSEDSGKISKSKPPSQRSSPILQKDVIKQVVTTGDNPLKNSFPLKSVNTNPARASPSHLTVPQPEQPERYLSGHLYLAKKLSDESVESSFFSEHTSSPSSTRTSSPIVPVSKATEQKQTPFVDSKNRQEGISGSFTFPPPYHPSLLNQQQVKYSPQPGHYDIDNIPNLSIFDQGMPHYSQGIDSIDVSSPYMYEGMDGAQFTDYIYQKVNPHSPDSGLCTSSESILSPYPNQTEYSVHMTRPYPLSTAEQSVEPQEHLNLRRAFSSTGNFKTAEDLHQKLGRRASGHASTQFGDEHLMIKPQNISASHQFGQPFSLNRQNSSSDPQMHTVGAGELQDSLSSLFSAGDSARNFKNQCSSYFQHPQRPVESQHRIQHPPQQNTFLLSPQLPKPKMNNSNYAHRPSISNAAQSLYSPFPQNSLSAHNTSHPSQFPMTTGAPPNLVTATIYNPNAHHQHQPSVIYQPQYDQMFSSARRQSVPSHSHYQHHYNIIPNNPAPAFGYSGHQQILQSSRSASMPYISHEDAPILPDDPRYTIYYHLSNVFTEVVVRRVMNLNPNELNPDCVCQLILKYKEDTGH